MRPQDDKYIFTDDTDYSDSSKSSVWGTEEESTKKCIINSNVHGSWLNLCAGDGRFNNLLLQRANKVVVADIDINPLNKLKRNTPDSLKNKLTTQIFNIVGAFPFQNKSFDGIFCVGTLHLFSKNVLQEIVSEMSRVLKEDGIIIIDFATDIQRVQADGTNWVVDNEPSYIKVEAIKLLKDLFNNYKTEMVFDYSEPEKVDLGYKTYTFSCNFILLKAESL